MNELVKALRQYIARDLVFLVSGSWVVVTFLYVFGSTAQIDPSKWPPPAYLLGAGIAYVIGYLLQDVFSVFRLVTTAPMRRPWPVLRRVYRRFERRPWRHLRRTENVKFLYDQQTKWEAASAKGKAPNYQRLIMLLQIGTSGGPCAFVCAGLLAWRVRQCHLFFDKALFVGTIALCAALITLGWLKVAQMTQCLRGDPPS